MMYFANILISAVVGIIATIGAYNYLPLSFIEKFGPEVEQKIGATITTIAATDTLRDSRSIINTDLTNLNTDKMEGSTTSVASITTLANLVTVGTLTSGSLGSGFTAVTVPRGGTGSTTLSQYQLLLGNGTGNVTTTNDGLGTSGQFLQSQGNGSPPSWETSSIDQAAAYTWTGQHNFNTGATSTSATTTSFYVSGHASTSQITTNSLGVGIATSSQGNLRVQNYLQVDGTASSSNLIISGTNGCTGCQKGYEQITNTGAGPTTPETTATVSANCSAGKKVVGGGGSNSLGDSEPLAIISSYPADNDTWTIVYNNTSATITASANTMTVYAICVVP